MSKGLPPAWKDAANASASAIRLEDWKAALIKTSGNISLAAKAVNIDRSHATRLNKKFDLIEFAAALRLQAGAARTKHGPRAGIVTGMLPGTPKRGRSKE